MRATRTAGAVSVPPASSRSRARPPVQPMTRSSAQNGIRLPTEVRWHPYTIRSDRAGAGNPRRPHAGDAQREGVERRDPASGRQAADRHSSSPTSASAGPIESADGDHDEGNLVRLPAGDAQICVRGEGRAQTDARPGVGGMDRRFSAGLVVAEPARMRNVNHSRVRRLVLIAAVLPLAACATPPANQPPQRHTGRAGRGNAQANRSGRAAVAGGARDPQGADGLPRARHGRPGIRDHGPRLPAHRAGGDAIASDVNLAGRCRGMPRS